MVYRSLLRHFSSESTIFTSLAPRRLRWSAGGDGRSSPNRVPAPHSGMSLLVHPDRSADHHFQKKRKENSLRLECPDANGPGLLRAGPSGEKRCTQHHTVPVSPQCPQEISLLTLPVFQGAVVSSERFSQSLPALKCSGAGRLATPSGVIRAARSAVSFRSPS